MTTYEMPADPQRKVKDRYGNLWAYIPDSGLYVNTKTSESMRWGSLVYFRSPLCGVNNIVVTHDDLPPWPHPEVTTIVDRRGEVWVLEADSKFFSESGDRVHWTVLVRTAGPLTEADPV